VRVPEGTISFSGTRPESLGGNVDEAEEGNQDCSNDGMDFVVAEGSRTSPSQVYRSAKLIYT
jgi:hypothetical protein